MAQGGQEN